MTKAIWRPIAVINFERRVTETEFRFDLYEQQPEL